MTDAKYEDRQNLEFFRWPDLTRIFQDLVQLVMIFAQ